VTAAFSATLPAGWRTVSVEVAMDGYRRTVVESPGAGTVANIDRTPNPGTSLGAHADSVETATARTPGYRRISVADGTVAGSPTITWSFSLAGQPDSERVDVFRSVGDDLFAVLGMSDSLTRSRAAATRIAAGLTVR
jgi:hypothetical protein